MECNRCTRMVQGIHIELSVELRGHNGWVTSIATTMEAPNMLLTGSRGKYLHIDFIIHLAL